MIAQPMPQDILKYKAKFALNLTTRQCVCYGVGIACVLLGMFTIFPALISDMKIRMMVSAALGVPAFLWGSLMPFGQPMEKIIGPFIQDNILNPSLRVKEIHFPEVEADRTGGAKKAKPSKTYPAIR